ncbi:hypothetical protein PsYK624_155860 [Phanerochaete sordida]|uniref:Uncharacterized protein n=1 Tax=Phanerochaete sordida TaxID=48140 RepID=A0A9P3GPH3_9APHY|nr:hypothetical protein PsYK624_155860 [Phanerochaete sordida]
MMIHTPVTDALPVGSAMLPTMCPTPTPTAIAAPAVAFRAAILSVATKCASSPREIPSPPSHGRPACCVYGPDTSQTVTMRFEDRSQSMVCPRAATPAPSGGSSQHLGAAHQGRHARWTMGAPARYSETGRRTALRSVDGAAIGKLSSTSRGQRSQRRRFDARHRDICWAIARGLCVA